LVVISEEVGINLVRTQGEDERRMFVPAAQRTRKEIKNSTGENCDSPRL
jgi:hypothetical protein